MTDLTIYMKSGNKILVDKVTDWKIKYNNSQVTFFSLSQIEAGFFRCKNRLIVGSIDLKNIECVVEHK